MKLKSQFPVYAAAVLALSGLASAQKITARAEAPNMDATVKSAQPAGPVAHLERFEVGPADVLKIAVWKEPELSQTVVIRPDGFISLPLVHDVNVKNKTTTEIEALLASMLNSYIVNPQVSVNLLEIHSKVAYITGEVGKPGAYPLTGPIDVLQLIAKAGGLTQFAKRKNILLIHTDETGQHRSKLDYSKFVDGKTDPKSFLLRAGDTVVVP